MRLWYPSAKIEMLTRNTEKLLRLTRKTLEA